MNYYSVKLFYVIYLENWNVTIFKPLKKQYRWWNDWGENTGPGVSAWQPTREFPDSDEGHGEHHQEAGGDDR